MVSPELIRRYPLTANLTMEQIVALAMAAKEFTVEKDAFIFQENDELDHFFMVLDGKVGILVGQPGAEMDRPDTFYGAENIISTVCPGEIFGWSGLVPPQKATSSARAMIPTQIISVDCRELQQAFEKDYRFAFIMMQTMAQVIRDRLHDLRVECLSTMVPDAA
jgi:CRP-like cAMP-binding protein